MYHRIPKVTTTVSFGFSSIGSVTFWRLLHLDTKIYKFVNVKNIAKSILSGGGSCYYREVVSFGGSLLWGISTIRKSLLSGGRYYQEVVTFGGSLLLGGRYYREIVTFGRPLLSGDRYFREAVTIGGSSRLEFFRMLSWQSGGRMVSAFNS